MIVRISIMGRAGPRGLTGYRDRRSSSTETPGTKSDLAGPDPETKLTPIIPETKLTPIIPRRVAGGVGVTSTAAQNRE
jgi:hypothetical protein